MNETKHVELRRRNTISMVADFLRSYPTILIIVVMMIGFSIITKSIFSASTVRTMMAVNTVSLICAIGETFVLFTGGIDLSVATVVSVSAVISATFMKMSGGNALVGISVAILVGLFFGVINGVLIGYGRMNSFITTMGTNLVARGVAFMMSLNGRGIKASKEFVKFGLKTFLGIPLIALIGFALVIVFSILHKKTFWGRDVILIGSNRTSAKYSGIKTEKIEASVYIVSGFLAGIAGFISVINLGAGIPGVGDKLLLTIIAAVVMGGTSMFGGEGSIIRTLIGIVLIAVLTQGLDRMHVAFYDQFIILGVLIFIGNSLTMRISSRSSRAMQ